MTTRDAIDLAMQALQVDPWITGRGTARCFWCRGWERHPHMDEDYHGTAGHLGDCLRERALTALEQAKAQEPQK